jgi:DNA repair protein RecN (Recombination protein N)
LIRNNHVIDNFLSDAKEDFEKLSEKIDQQNSEIDAAISSFDAQVRTISGSENNLEEIEERLFFLRSLARKFNVKVSDLAEIILQSYEKLKLLTSEEEMTSDLENQSFELKKEYKKIADELSLRRKKSALILSEKVEAELKFLKMDGVKFLVEVKNHEDASYQGSSGYDKIRFLAAINQNNFDDISKIASGGELSRFMLALKVALIDVKSVPTMIFDEIDSGIGGSTADAVGKRLKILSQTLQIFVVTHQPQIAAKSNTHFKISKIFDLNKTKTIIEKLDEGNRQNEIARMLSGETISKEAVAAANSLINA